MDDEIDEQFPTLGEYVLTALAMLAADFEARARAEDLKGAGNPERAGYFRYFSKTLEDFAVRVESDFAFDIFRRVR